MHAHPGVCTPGHQYRACQHNVWIWSNLTGVYTNHLEKTRMPPPMPPPLQLEEEGLHPVLRESHYALGEGERGLHPVLRESHYALGEGEKVSPVGFCSRRDPIITALEHCRPTAPDQELYILRRNPAYRRYNVNTVSRFANTSAKRRRTSRQRYVNRGVYAVGAGNLTVSSAAHHAQVG